MIPEHEDFAGTWPFKPHYFEGRGFRQHYVDERESGDETLVCLHGEPTWGYLYLKFIPRLARNGRVVVPDHMGFGKSATPQDRAYSIRDHVENLEALLLHLHLRARVPRRDRVLGDARLHAAAPGGAPRAGRQARDVRARRGGPRDPDGVLGRRVPLDLAARPRGDTSRCRPLHPGGRPETACALIEQFIQLSR